VDVNKDFKLYRRSAAGAIFYTTYILIGNILTGVQLEIKLRSGNLCNAELQLHLK
jgi:hypothetical protein